MGGTTNSTLNAKGTVKYDKNSIFVLKYMVESGIDMSYRFVCRNLYLKPSKRQLLRLHENHQNVKFHLDEPSLKETDPFRFHSYYLVTRPKTYAQNITKRVSPLMPIQVKPLSGPRVSFQKNQGSIEYGN